MKRVASLVLCGAIVFSLLALGASASEEKTPPVLLAYTVLTPGLAVPGGFVVRLEYTSGNGLAMVRLSYALFVDGQRVSSHTLLWNGGTDAGEGPFDIEFPLDETMAAGEYLLTAVILQDKNGLTANYQGDATNGVLVNWASAHQLPCALWMELTNQPKDTTPPRLDALAFEAELELDEHTALDVTFTAQEEESGLAALRLLYRHEETARLFSLAQDWDTPLCSGSYSATLPLPPDLPAGDYTLVSATLADAAQNTATYQNIGDSLAETEAGHTIEASTAFRLMAPPSDTTAPLLTGLLLHNTMLPTDGTLLYDFVLGEEESGLAAMELHYTRTLRDGSTGIHTLRQEFSQPLLSGTHSLALPLAGNMAAMRYSLKTLHLWDAAGNQRTYTMADGGALTDAEQNRLPAQAGLHVSNAFAISLYVSANDEALAERLALLDSGETALLYAAAHQQIDGAVLAAAAESNLQLVVEQGDAQWVLQGAEITAAHGTVLLEAAIEATDGTPYGLPQAGATLVTLETENLPENTSLRIYDAALPAYATFVVNGIVLDAPQPVTPGDDDYLSLPLEAGQLRAQILLSSTPPVDKSALAQLVAGAETIQPQGYTQASYRALQEAVVAAKRVLADLDANQQTVDEAVRALQNAIDALEAVNTTELAQLVTKAEAIQPQRYTQASYRALQEAVAVANRVLADLNANQYAVDAAAKALQNAIDALEAVDDSRLAQLVAYAEALQPQGYTQSSYRALQEAIREAKQVLADADASQQTIDAAHKALQNAVNALESVDKTALAQLVAIAEAIPQEGYTPSSYQTLQTAITDAKQVLADANAGQQATDEALAALQNAIDALEAVDKVALAQLVADTQALAAEAYTPESYQALQNALAAAGRVLADPDATQTAVDNATQNLQKALDALETIAPILPEPEPEPEPEPLPEPVPGGAPTTGEAATLYIYSALLSLLGLAVLLRKRHQLRRL